MLHRLFQLVIVLIAALGTPVAATAAVAYLITTEPAEPHIGEPVTIHVTTFAYVDPPATPFEPLPLDEFPWTFVADSPTGERHVITLERLGSSRNQWTSRFTFVESGRWEVGLDPRHLGTPIDAALGARVVVDVRSRTEPAVPIGAALVALVGALAAIALTKGYRGRSASHIR